VNDWAIPEGSKAEPHVIMPLVDLLGDGFVNITWPEDKITAHLEGLWRSGNRFETVVRITHKDLGIIHAPTRINLLSTSARTELRRSLDHRFPQVGWATRIDQIVSEADRAYRISFSITTVGEKEPSVSSRLVSPLLETGRLTALAAEAGTGKSMLALTLALQIGGHGVLIPGTTAPEKPGKSLYLDWEDEWDTHARRQAAILKGAGKTAPPTPIKHIRMSGMLVDQADWVLRVCRAEAPALVIVDSVGKAVMGHINEPEFVLPLMDVCRSMKTTVLLLGHLPKHESDGRLIGTVFWFTEPRQGWHMAKAQEPGESETYLALNHTKANNWAITKPLGLKVEIEQEGDKLDTVRYYAVDIAKTPDLEKHAVASDRIHAYLLVSGRQQIAQIMEALGLPYETVRKALSRSKGKRFQSWGGGRTAEWGVLSGQPGQPGQDSGTRPDNTGTPSGTRVPNVSVKGGGGTWSLIRPVPPHSKGEFERERPGQGGISRDASQNRDADDDIFDALDEADKR